jgi:hypothetical protein
LRIEIPFSASLLFVQMFILSEQDAEAGIGPSGLHPDG